MFVGDLILSNCICLCLLPPPLPDQKNPTGINKSQNTDMKKMAVHDADCMDGDSVCECVSVCVCAPVIKTQ